MRSPVLPAVFVSEKTFFRLLAPLILSASIIMSGCASQEDSLENALKAEASYNEALKYQSVNKTDAVEEKIKEAVKLDPLEPKYHLNLGKFYFSENQLDLAEKEFLQTIQLNDTFHEPYRQLGRLYLQKNDYPKALDYLEQSLTKIQLKNPQQVHNWMALCYYKMDNFAGAEKSWLKALNYRENEYIRLNLALAYRDNERFDEAEKTLKKAVIYKPGFAPAHYHLGLLYLKKQDFPQAKKHFDRVVTLKPNSQEAQDSRKFLELMRQ